MVGADGERPKTLLETLNWLAQQAVVPTHVIGKSFEAALRDDATPENNLLDMMAKPKELRGMLELLPSPFLVLCNFRLDSSFSPQVPTSLDAP